MSATRRRLLTASISLAISRVSSRYIRPAAAAQKSITFVAYGGLFQDLYEPGIVEPFRRTHSDVSVFYDAVPSSTQALALLRRQRERPEIDVVLLDLAAARTATDEGLLEPLPPGSMPVLGELAQANLFSGVAGPALFTEPLVMLFDAGRARPAPTWKTLWSGMDERSIAIPAPPDSIGVAFTLVAGRLFGGGNEPRAVADGITAINELSRQIVTWDPRPDVYRFIGGGDAKMGVGWNMSAQVTSDRLGGRLGVVFPTEGTISRVSTVNLVKGSRQPEAARQFIAWLLGAEAQRTMVEQMFLGPVNAKARYTEGALSRTANTRERAARAMPVDWVAVNSIRDDIIRRWREVIPGSG
jgi:putative spermidine/putrescine transport system substrate-binding protein